MLGKVFEYGDCFREPLQTDVRKGQLILEIELVRKSFLSILKKWEGDGILLGAQQGFPITQAVLLGIRVELHGLPKFLGSLFELFLFGKQQSELAVCLSRVGPGASQGFENSLGENPSPGERARSLANARPFWQCNKMRA